MRDPVDNKMSKIRVWFLASRPKTLFAAAVPVVIGSALAFRDSGFSPLTALIILLTALLIQVGTNFVNDLVDFERGADTEERQGPLRVTQAGLVSPNEMRRASAIVLGSALLLGLYLVSLGGIGILLIGAASLVCAVAYTAGPFPLAYLGLGELFVLLFFGPVAVAGTSYLLTGSLSRTAILLGLSPGFIASAILVVNNLRDVETDEKSGKRTTAVRFGPGFARIEFALLLLLAGAIPAVLALAGLASPGAALGSLYLLPASKSIRAVRAGAAGAALNEVLEQTGKLLGLFGLLICAGLLL